MTCPCPCKQPLKTGRRYATRLCYWRTLSKEQLSQFGKESQRKERVRDYHARVGLSPSLDKTHP